MFVCVLTMGFWPTYPTVTAILPAEVKLSRVLFIDFEYRFVALSFARNLYEILS